MFKFLQKAKSAKELDRIAAEIDLNVSNNYKDAAQEALKEYEKRFTEMAENGELSESQKSEYRSRLNGYKEKMKKFTHKDQKPYWAKE